MGLDIVKKKLTFPTTKKEKSHVQMFDKAIIFLVEDDSFSPISHMDTNLFSSPMEIYDSLTS